MDINNTCLKTEVLLITLHFTQTFFQSKPHTGNDDESIRTHTPQADSAYVSLGARPKTHKTRKVRKEDMPDDEGDEMGTPRRVRGLSSTPYNPKHHSSSQVPRQSEKFLDEDELGELQQYASIGPQAAKFQDLSLRTVPANRSDSGLFLMPLSTSNSRTLNLCAETVNISYNMGQSQQIKDNSELKERDRFPEVLLEPLRPLDTGDWKRLASRLGLDSFIDSIATEARNTQESPIQLVMVTFWQVEGKKANIERVKEALRDMKRQDVLDDLEDAEKKYNINTERDDTQ